MSVIVHGTAGLSLGRESSTERFGQDARHGAWFEGLTARVLEAWLGSLPGTRHLFHDLTGLADISGYGFTPMGLGQGNIDHVILTGAGYLVVNAKGLGPGTLKVGPDGRGLIVKPDGTERPQPWMDERRAWSQCGIVTRLTGMSGRAAAVVPDRTDVGDPSLPSARCMQRGFGAIVTLTGVEEGALADCWPELFGTVPAASGLAVMALARYASDPGTVRQVPARAPRPLQPARSRRRPPGVDTFTLSNPFGTWADL